MYALVVEHGRGVAKTDALLGFAEIEIMRGQPALAAGRLADLDAALARADVPVVEDTAHPLSGSRTAVSRGLAAG